MNKAKKYSLSDIPLSESVNDFGVEGYVQGLERFIKHAATPLTIALQGEWGSGKTSLMNRLYNDLCTDDKDFIGINVNTWEYSMLASPEETVVKIIGKLVSSLSENDEQASSKAGQYLRGVLNFAYRVGREALKGVMPGAGLIVEGVGMANELPEGKSEEKVITISDLKKALTEAINKRIDDSNKKGVIVFVDDLDRLNPPLAVQILELLKNIFTLDNCIFVLAIDYEVVVKGLEPKFGKKSDSNEREFRSFFDKIIQVPFSLPVNSYKPMDFVLDSLVEIGYFSSTERNLPWLQKKIERLVVSSVGKNPRSIKRLINTLSLLDCIGKCSAIGELSNTLDHRIVNFAIVAMQVCYQKLYDLLFINPIFDKWDETIVSKLNLHLDEQARKSINGDIILDAMCEKDVYLNNHHQEILNLFKIIYDTAESISETPVEILIKEILDRSSITNVSSNSDIEELDRKALIYKLHDNVWNYIDKKHPGIRSQFKRNTGNGGYYIYLPDDSYFEVIFQPSQNEDMKTIHLRIWLNIWNTVPDSLEDKNLDEILNTPQIKNVILPMEETVARLSEKGIIEGRTWDDKIFSSFTEEQLYRQDELNSNNYYVGDTDYWVNLSNASDFEDPTIIKGIGDLILAAYELNARAQNISL